MAKKKSGSSTRGYSKSPVRGRGADCDLSYTNNDDLDDDIENEVDLANGLNKQFANSLAIAKQAPSSIKPLDLNLGLENPFNMEVTRGAGKLNDKGTELLEFLYIVMPLHSISDNAKVKLSVYFDSTKAQKSGNSPYLILNHPKVSQSKIKDREELVDYTILRHNYQNRKNGKFECVSGVLRTETMVNLSNQLRYGTSETILNLPLTINNKNWQGSSHLDVPKDSSSLKKHMELIEFEDKCSETKITVKGSRLYLHWTVPLSVKMGDNVELQLDESDSEDELTFEQMREQQKKMKEARKEDATKGNMQTD